MEPAKYAITGIVGLILTLVLTRRWSRREQYVARFSLLAHVFAALAQELIYRNVYGGGDMLLYQYYGRALGDLMLSNPTHYLPEVGSLLFQLEHELPFYIIGEGSSTGSMAALAAILSAVWSNELYVAGAVVGVASTAGAILTHSVVREDLQAKMRLPVCIALLLVPSVVFWTSALLKEAVIALPIGMLFVGVHTLFKRRRRILGLTLIALGALVVSLFKPYVLAGFFAGIPSFYLANRARERGRPISLTLPRTITLVVGALVFVVLFGQLFADYDVARLGEELASEQRDTFSTRGGSTYQLVDPEARTLSAQLAFAPLALFTTCFRPLIFEAHNLQAAVNATEATFILILFVVGIRRSRLGFIKVLLDRPALLFMSTFALVVGVGVGLATTNMGTLSRYRAPIYSLLAAVVVVAARYSPTAMSEPRLEHQDPP